MNTISSIQNLDVKNKRVLLRVDLNVSIKNGHIIDDFKIKEIIPTLDYLLNQKSRIIILTHIGRPQQNPDTKISTSILIPWFAQHNYAVQFCATLADVDRSNAPIILLENIRFFAGEQTDNLSQAHQFAQALAQLGDIYINDAFGMLHRTDTSITLLAQQFDHAHKAYGFLVAKEIKTFDTIMHAPKHPFLLIVGGNKATTKIPIVKNLLNTVDTILLCPAIAFTFLHAMGKPIGKSLHDPSVHNQCLEILNIAKKNNITILFPSDYIVAHNTINGPLSTTIDDIIDAESIGISIGPKTTKLFVDQIQKAQTILFNGAIGFLEKPDTIQGMHTLFNAMADSHATTIIAGGDSVAATHYFGMENQINHLSTGGGAVLCYLSGAQLPGLAALENRTKT